MLALDAVFLSRLQFAITIGFHYLFPPLTIGLGLLMVIMEGIYLRTGNLIYESMAKFWTKIFALIFAIGVASGIVMEFQFGTNWSTYSRFVGDIFGAALAAEGIFAFFLESGFLAVLVFGWDRVSPAMHFFSTLMVSLGSMFSAVWIIVANSWQQTPAGYKLAETGIFTPEGNPVMRAELVDFWVAVFNHSTIERLTHTLVGAFIAAGFFVMSVAAFYLLRKRHEDFARRTIMIAMPFTLIASVLALVTGHVNGQMIAEHQPAKLAAFEGQFETAANAPLHIFGIPNTETGEVDFGLAMPGMLSFLAHNDTEATVIGLDQFPREDWPPVQLSFQSFHLMVGLGMLFIILSAIGTIMLFGGRLFRMRWLLWILVFAVVGPMIANELGWIAAEVGRQPWIVYNELRTADAASPSVPAEQILASMIMFCVIYLLLMLTWLFLLDRKIRTGPETVEQLAEAKRKRGGEGWLDVARARAEHGGDSMTEAHEDVESEHGNDAKEDR